MTWTEHYVAGYSGSSHRLYECDECAALVWGDHVIGWPDMRKKHEEWHRELEARLSTVESWSS